MAVNFSPGVYQPRSIDFSELANLPDNFWKGQAVRRENQLRATVDEIIKSGGGFPEVVKAITAVEPARGAALMANFENAQAMAGIRNFSALPDAEKTRQLYGGGARIGGGDAPNTAPMEPQPEGDSVESVNPNGPYIPQQAPGPIAGTGLVQPSNVPAPGYTNLPEDVQKAIAPAGSVEYAKKSAENRVEKEGKRPVDEALVANIDDKLGRLEQSASELLDNPNAPLEQRGPSKGLKSITGNYTLPNGYETPIPNAWLPNVSQEARNASAKLDNVVIQTGLGVLEQMRSATSTGASGMGQLAIEESRMLQNSIASYSQAQDPKAAATALRKVVYWTRRVRDISKKKFRDTYGADYVAPPPVEDGPADTPAEATPAETGDGWTDYGNGVRIRAR
jgi:hypothetical protein